MEDKRVRKFVFVLSCSIFVLVVLTTLSIYSLVNKKISLKLIGSEVVDVNVFSEYIDEGYRVEECKFGKCEEIDVDVIVSGDVDTSKVGTYEIKYTYKDKKKEIKRIINVIDNIRPIIELKGNPSVSICPSGKYVEEGYSAIDNYDGDITDKVSLSEVDEGILYSVSDSSNNNSSVLRNILYEDNVKPNILLTGKDVTLNYGSSYKEQGFKAIDNCDGDISSKVKVTNNVNVNKAGNYSVTYEVEDSYGNSTKVVRNVVVKSQVQNTYTENNDLTAYLNSKGYKVSVAYVDLTTNYQYTYNASKVYYGASLIKTLDALYIYNKTEVTPTNRDLVNLAISKSDNAAHSSLVNTIGRQNLKNYGLSLGAKYTLSGSDNYGNTVLADQVVYMKELYRFINNNPKGNELKGFFVNDFYNNLLFDGLPTLLHKYGLYGINYHEAGIVLDSHPYIIVILSNGNYYGTNVLQDISKHVYEFHKSRY